MAFVIILVWLLEFCLMLVFLARVEARFERHEWNEVDSTLSPEPAEHPVEVATASRTATGPGPERGATAFR